MDLAEVCGQEQAKRALILAAAGLDRHLGEVVVSSRPDLAQFQCNGALPAARTAGRNSREIAADVVNSGATRHAGLELSATIDPLEIVGAHPAQALRHVCGHAHAGTDGLAVGVAAGFAGLVAGLVVATLLAWLTKAWGRMSAPAPELRSLPARERVGRGLRERRKARTVDMATELAEGAVLLFAAPVVAFLATLLLGSVLSR